MALVVMAAGKLAIAAASLPHGLVARYYANAAIEGRLPAGLVPGGQRWSTLGRLLGGTAALGLLAALTYPPRLPLLLPLLAGAIWTVRRTAPDRPFSLDQ